MKLFFSLLLVTIPFLSYTMDENEAFEKNMQLLPPALCEYVNDIERLIQQNKHEVHAWVNPHNQPIVIFGDLTPDHTKKANQHNPSDSKVTKEMANAMVDAINYLKKKQ